MKGVSPFSILLCLSDATIRILASSPFKFIIDGNVLYIHAGLIALHSLPLDRMINGPMSEAQKGCAELPDVDKGTFIRFIRWAYSGMYFAAEIRTEPTQELFAVGKPIKPTLEEPPTPEDDEYQMEPVEIGTWGQALALPTKKIKKGARRELVGGGLGLRESFNKLRYPVPETTLSTPPHRPNQGPLEDYSEVFLSHARVYVFADKYDIEPLKKLALHNLHQTLVSYTLYPKRCRDIIELIRYSYTHTADRGEGVEGLRALLTHYMGLEMARLVRDEGFKTLLLESEGEILGDFLNKVIERID